MKKAISIILALVMTLAVLTACGSSSTQPAETSAPAANDAAASAEPAKDVRLLKTSMPTAWDETHGYTQALIAMNKYLDEVSGGTLQLDIYAGGQLGDETAIFECLQLGTVDCAIFNAASLSNFTHALEAFDLPYLYTDDEGWANQELQNAVVSSDFARGYLDKVYEETTVHAVGFLYNAARDFFLNKPLDSLADASKIKLRSMTAQMHLDMYTAMGFVATPMGYSEVYNAMQTGVIDGFEDTAKMTGRREYVSKLAKEYDADGIIYEQIKFCDPWAYERMMGSHIMHDDYGYPVLSVDRPYNISSSGQMRTRVQAFVESIEIKKIQGGDK